MAKWKGSDACVLLPSGYQANLAAVQTLALVARRSGKKIRFLIDKLCHASLIDAVHQSGEPMRVFPHNHLEKLHRLLSEGRASESSFDTKPSPLGAFLHQTVGEPALMRGVELARRWWAGASDARAFLASQPARPVAAIARAAANTMETRHDRLLALAEAIEAAA